MPQNGMLLIHVSPFQACSPVDIHAVLPLKYTTYLETFMLRFDALLCDVIPILDCQNDWLDMIEQISIAYTIGSEQSCRTGSDEALLLQHVHILFYCVSAVDPNGSTDGFITGIALVRFTILQIEEVGIDSQFTGREIQRKDFIRQHEVMRACVRLVPTIA